jgi:aspartyl/asparaginyl-tRNA synthetase
MLLLFCAQMQTAHTVLHVCTEEMCAHTAFDVQSAFNHQGLCCVVCAQVLVRGRLYTVRGKGKSAFLMIRLRTATVQVRGCSVMQYKELLYNAAHNHSSA